MSNKASTSRWLGILPLIKSIGRGISYVGGIVQEFIEEIEEGPSANGFPKK